MITLKELLGKYKPEDIPEEYVDHLIDLLNRVNVVREKWGHPMIVTSGYRSVKDHLEIYKKKGITDQSKIPMKSKHLYGLAVDIADPKGLLQAWCKANEKTLEEVGLWMEDFSATKGWVHFQCVPPASGKRWFLP
jgi:uncharacterized protein YcbK (DUF882 family)